jgi:small subunit ribosomal protein S20
LQKSKRRAWLAGYYESSEIYGRLNMPNSESAKKRLRQNVTRNAHNRAVKSNVRGHIRKVRAAVAAGNLEESETAFRTTVRKLD